MAEHDKGISLGEIACMSIGAVIGIAILNGLGIGGALGGGLGGLLGALVGSFVYKAASAGGGKSE